jgi:hypothetical protein
MVLPEDLLVVVPLLVGLLLRICILLVRAFFCFVVLSTRMVRELYDLFHLHLVDPAGQVLLPEIMPRRRH